jgi:hypothetical protein
VKGSWCGVPKSVTPKPFFKVPQTEKIINAVPAPTALKTHRFLYRLAVRTNPILFIMLQDESEML